MMQWPRFACAFGVISIDSCSIESAIVLSAHSYELRELLSCQVAPFPQARHCELHAEEKPETPCRAETRIRKVRRPMI
jgi:hypothetical protein